MTIEWHRVFNSPNCLWPSWNFTSFRHAMMHCMTEFWWKRGVLIELRTNCNCSKLFRTSNVDSAGLEDLLTNIGGLILILMLYMNVFNLAITIVNLTEALAHHAFNLMEEGSDNMVEKMSTSMTQLQSLLQHHRHLAFNPSHPHHTMSFKPTSHNS
jgi:hypothetical protein